MNIRKNKNIFVFSMIILLVMSGLVVFSFSKTNFLNSVKNALFADSSSTPSTYLKKLSLKGYEGVNTSFVAGEDGTYDYDLDEVIYTIPIFEDDDKLRLFYEKEYDGATVSINRGLTVGVKDDKDGEYIDTAVGDGLIYIDVTAPGVTKSMYALEYQAVLDIDDMPVQQFNSTGGYQRYVVPRSGTYKIDLYGAPGGAGCLISGGKCTTTYKGGQGAHTYGTITLRANDILYFYVGETGTSYISSRVGQTFVAGGWNGGGKGYKSSNGSYGAGGGGGATDVRLESGAWNNPDSLKTRIMVAAGGGGGAYNDSNATWSSQGGGLYVDGLSTTYCVANQTTGFARGTGSDGVTIEYSRAGSGGGYFGGDGYVHPVDTVIHGSGCGGSSYISGHKGSIGVDADGNAVATEARDITDSYNYTGYVFLDTGMIDGGGHVWTDEPNETVTSIGSAGGKATIQQLTKYVEVDNYLSNIVYSTGTLSPSFDPKVDNYELTLDLYTPSVIISGEVVNSSLTSVSDCTTYNLEPGETKIVQIFATDIATGSVRTYYIKISREALKPGNHTTKLLKIKNPNHDDILIDSNTFTYALPISYGKMSIDLGIIPYDKDVDIKVEGNTFLPNDTGVITITVTDDNLPGAKTVYTLNYTRETSVDPIEDDYKFKYVGKYQTFTVPMSGDYLIETWGAAGGTMGSGWTGVGGPGGYTAGIVNLTKGTNLYVYVGNKGVGYTSNGPAVKNGGWNGGGSVYGGASGGGGATDVRLIAGDALDGKSLNSRIIVAGGGGGSNDSQNGGAGGGLVAENGVNGSVTNGAGGTQLQGGAGGIAGAFGSGGSSVTSATTDGGAGGGGYYGGGKATGNAVAGGGGSSYISGYKGAIAVTSSTVSTPRKDSEGDSCTTLTAQNDVTCSYHYSGLIFKDIVMVSGRETMPTIDKLSTMQGNSGEGYAIITPLSSKSENNFLKNITFDHGSMNKLFNPIDYEYEIIIGMYYQYINLEGITYDKNATVNGDGKLKLNVGENKFDIVVTAENGETRIYTVNVIREGLKGVHSNALNYIDIDKKDTIYVEQNKYEYDIKIPYNKYSLDVEAVPYEDDPEVIVTVEGAGVVASEKGTIVITVSHKDVTPTKMVYKINYERQIPLYEPEKLYTYTCTKKSASFQAFLDGDYRLELWGAAGGGATRDIYSPSHGGPGGYTTGTINLKQGEYLYIYVGCQGTYSNGLNVGGGWNGGGHGGGGGYGGGGASDIRYDGNTLAKRIMVAGGGGGADNGGGSYGGGDDGSGGAGGGLTGENAKINGRYQPNTAGTQESGYALGAGGSVTYNTDTGGGGGGYYGGRVTNNNNGGAGGGSGFIDNDVIFDSNTISGNASMPNFDGDHTMMGNTGDGFIKIIPLNLESENDFLDELKYSRGTIDPSFTPGTTEYKITVDTYDSDIELTGVAADEYAYVSGNGKYDIDIGDNFFNISVTSAAGTIRIYKINVFRPMITDGSHSAELQKIKFGDYGDIVCEKGVYEYDFHVPESVYYLDVTPIPYDSTSKQTISGFNYISEKNTTATVVSRVTGGTPSRVTYKINIIKQGAQEQHVWKYDYTGEYQEFIAPYRGLYTVRLWGAQGGNSSGNGRWGCSYNRGSGYGCGGFGAFTSGQVLLEKGDKFYVYVGARGTDGYPGRAVAGGWNGGGNGNHDHSDDESAGAGGGATDIRLVPTSAKNIWNEFDSLKSRIMVAGGGGGASDGYYGGNGGGSSSAANRFALGATQTTGYALGQGESGVYRCGNIDVAGAGGGYHGGYSSPSGGYHCHYGQPASGGSSYVSGCKDCRALRVNATKENIIFSNSGEHYSGYVFENITMYYGGNGSMPIKSINVASEVGSYGNGYAMITYTPLSDNNFLYSLNVKANNQTKNISPAFEPTKEEYTLDLAPGESKINIIARPDDSTATVDGYGEMEVPVGVTDFEIKVTSESGKERIYKLTVSRSADTQIYPEDIKISGLIGVYCEMDDAYCNLYPSEFNKNQDTYSMTVPYKIRELNFDVVKAHDNQVVLGDGLIEVASQTSATSYVTIQVQSEDCAHRNDLSPGCLSTYSYAITRDIAKDNDLLEIKVVDPQREIEFDPDVYEYSTSIPYEYTKIEDLRYTLSSNKANVVVTGNEDMHLGDNLITFTVTSLSGDIKIYKLNVYREKSTVTYLSRLELFNIGEDSIKNIYTPTPAFSQKNFGTYDITIPYELDNLYVDTEVLATGLADYKIEVKDAKLENKIHIYDIPIGYSYVNIIVTAQDGSTDTYKIRIIRKKDSTDYLTKLVLKVKDKEYPLDPEFDPETLQYRVDVPSGTTEVDFDLEAASDKATISYPKGKKIVVGDNDIIVRVTAQDGTTRDYHILVHRPYNNSNRIASLSLTNNDTEYTLDPEFDPDTNMYTLTVPNSVSSLYLSAILESPLATLSNNNKINYLKVGENRIELDVYSEAGILNPYLIIITRLPNEDATLKSITFTSGDVIIVEEGKLDYELNVPNTYKTLDLTAVPTVSTTTYKKTIPGSLSTTAPNKFIIDTTAEDQVTKLRYTINVIRDKSNNANLSYLIMEEGKISPVFDPYTLTYTAKVPNEITSGTFHIETENPTTTYQILNNNFEVGENTVLIKTIPETGEKDAKTYTIKVIRQPFSLVSTYLEDISASAKLTPDFEKTRMYYEITVPYEIDYFKVHGTPEDPASEVSGNGSYNLNVGKNLIALTVTGTDQSTRDYQIVVTREKSTEARLSHLAIDGIVLSPSFDPDEYSYYVTTQDQSLKFSVIRTMDPNATYTVTYNYPIDVKNDYIVTIEVVAPNGINQKIYTINVKKLPSQNAYLKSLSVEGYTFTPKFEKTITVYTMHVASNVGSILVYAIPENNEATVYGDGVVSTDSLVTNAQILVVAGDGTEMVYTIVVYREASKDATLKLLNVENGIMNPTFDPDVTTYEVTLPYGVDKVDLQYKTTDPNATSYASSLDVSKTDKVTIKVTAEDGKTTRTYTLNIKHEKIVSDKLKSLEVKDYLLSPAFNSDILEYDILLNNEDTEIEFSKIETLDPDATYTVSSLTGFTDDDTMYHVYITVTASDGIQTKTYKLNVFHQHEAINYLNYIYYYLDKDTTIYFPEPTFNKFVKTYTAMVDNKTNKINLQANYPSNVKVSGLGEYTLETGVNILPIKVLSVDNIERTYIVKVIKAGNDENLLTYVKFTSNKGENLNNYLDRPFDPEVNNYILNAPDGTKTISVDGQISDKATVSGFTNWNINVGANLITVVVTSESGVANTYTFTVIRNASSDNSLVDLSPSDGMLEPSFKPDIFDYNLELDSSVATLSFTYKSLSGLVTVVGADEEIVPDGISTRTIIVTAEDGSSQTYYVHITKSSANNAYLKSLEVKNAQITPMFDSSITTYFVTVPNSKKTFSSADVVAIPSDGAAKIQMSSTIKVLTTEYTDFTIVVTAADGVTKSSYVIKVIREIGQEHTLKSLKIKAGSTSNGYIKETFSPSRTDYTYMIPAIKETVSIDDFIYTLTDENSKVEYDAPITMAETPSPWIFKIKVIAEDDSGYTTYNIKIVYDYNSDNTLSSLSVQNGVMKPAFKSGLYEYTVYEYEGTTSDVITAKTNLTTAAIMSGVGTVNLSGPEQYEHVVVKAEDGSLLTYTLHFINTFKNDTELDDLFLRGLDELNCLKGYCELSPAFSESVVYYTINVPFEYYYLDLGYIFKNDEQTLKIFNNNKEIKNGKFKLAKGLNEFQIKVYDGLGKETVTYTLIVDRKNSSNTLIKSLNVYNVDDGSLYEMSPEFNPETYEYQIDVSNDVDNVKLTALTDYSGSFFSTAANEIFYKYVEDSTTIVKFNGYNQLQDGDNIVTATSTAPDGTIRQYVIHVIKKPKYNSWLSGISVSTGSFWQFTPKFSKINYTYYLTIPNQYDMVYIDASPEDPTTVVRGTGQYQLNMGINTITLVSTAINGSISTYNVMIFQVADYNVDLKSLSLDECTISPQFDASIIHYTCEVEPDEENVTVHAVPDNSRAKVAISGDKKLVTGENVVEIQVLSEDKAKSKTYQVLVTRSINSNANLADIKITSPDGETEYPLNKAFNHNVTSYEVTVPYDVQQVVVDATKEVSTARITSGKGFMYLNYGYNEVEIEVLAEDKKTTKTYTVKINRTYNLNLANIKTNMSTIPLVPTFTPTNTTYSMTVPNNVKQIYVTGTPEDLANVTVTGSGSYTLSTQDATVVTLTTTDPLGNIQLYTVEITREKNSNAYAAAITMNEGSLDPDFVKTKQEYVVNVHPNVTSVNVNVTPEVNTTTYEIIGNTNLKKGENTVTVKMIAENDDKFYYTLKVVVQDEEFFANTLASITLSTPHNPDYEVSMNPSFDKDINFYSVTVPSTIDVLKIDATPTISTATVVGTGEKNLESGINIFTIKVTGADGNTNIYTINVHKMEDDASLDNLIIENHPFVFVKQERDYFITIDADEDYLNIIYEAADPNADVTIYGNGNLGVGENVIVITVETVTGKTEEYRIHVNKRKSNNPYLSHLAITDFEITPAFEPDTVAVYHATIPRTINYIYIEATPQDPKTTIEGAGSVEVQPGTNNYQIKTTAEDGTPFTYTIIVEKEVDSNTNLKLLEVSPGTLNPSFNKTVYNYEVVLDEGASSIRINAETESENSTVDGIGTYYLTSAITEIPIVVTAENNDSVAYNIKVVKRQKASPYLAALSAQEGELNPVFESETFEYQLVVPYEVEDLTLHYATVDDDAVVSVSDNENFELGNNEVTIRVLSSDNELATYKLYVIRQPYAINFLSSITVTNVEKTTTYELTPSFDKNTLYYETTVPNAVSKVKIGATLYDTTASVLSGAQTKTLVVGENRHVLTVTSLTGYVRTYVINIIRNTEDEDKATNYLKTLTEDVEGADLSPEFDSTVTNYSITVPSDVTSITFDATYPTGATVTGLGKSILKYGTSQRTITVTGIDGSVTNYYVNVTRSYTDRTKILDIIPSAGTLNYDEDKTEYEMEVPSDTTSISFEVLLENELASVTGNEETALSAGINVITITVTGDDGEEKIIHIFVTKKAGVDSITLEKNEIIIGVGESVSINYVIDPAEMNTTGVIWETEDKKIAEVATNGLITGRKPGETTITITSELNPDAQDTVKVTVIHKKLIPTKYEIVRKIASGDTDPNAEDYVYKADPLTSIEDFMKDFENPSKYLHLYDSTGKELDKASTANVGTGMYVTIEVNDTETDRCLVVVQGDSNGDGIISAIDTTAISNYILGSGITWLKKVTFDIDFNGGISAVDSTQMKNYVKGAITSFY